MLALSVLLTPYRPNEMTLTQIKVPDIGDFKDVPIIEIMVKPGDKISPEDPLVTLESDKATMDVPAPLGGVVKESRSKRATRCQKAVRFCCSKPTA